jgi:hypothetical protein
VLSLNGFQFGNSILKLILFFFDIRIEPSKEKILKYDESESLKRTVHIKNLKNVKFERI